eukprot:4145054-Amphidinium_carterae.5
MEYEKDLESSQSPFCGGPTLSDRINHHLDEKELEKLGSKLVDRQEEVAGEQRREFMKFRSEILAKVGVDEQKIRKITEDYLKTATGDGEKNVRIDMYSKAIRDVEENQKTVLATLSKLKESFDGRVLASSKDQERIQNAVRALRLAWVYTTDDKKFRVGEVVIFTDLDGNIEAHHVRGHGSLILDTPLTRDYPAGSEVRTLMGPERVYENGPKQYVGYDNGRQWIARVILPESGQSAIGTAQLGGSASPPHGTSVPVFGAPEWKAELRNPGVSVLGSPGISLGGGSVGVGGSPSTIPGQEGRDQARSASPITANDERILGRYFTRGSQGLGEEDRANVLRNIERGVLEPVNHNDPKERWSGLDSALPPLPQIPDEDKNQVHVRAAVERWESRLIQFYTTISPKAGAYIKAVLAGVAKTLPLYRKEHNPQVIQNMTFAEIAFHQIAEAHTCRFLGEMKLSSESYERAASIKLEPSATIQLLIHYDRILPPPPVELKRCQDYFLNPPCTATKPNFVCDEIMRWKGMGWRLRKLMKHYPTLNEMTQGFTTLVKGIVESHQNFQAKYQLHAMNLNTMTVTTEELIQFFTLVESLLTEFHSSKGYTTVLAPLVDYQQRNTGQKTPKLNATDGNKNQDNPDQKGKKGEGKGGKSGKKDAKDSPNKGKGGQPPSGPSPGGTPAGGGKKADGGKPSG